jgi:hypothetical protein
MENMKGFIKLDELNGIQVGSYYNTPVIVSDHKVVATLDNRPGRAIRIVHKEGNLINVLGYIFPEPQSDNKFIIEWLVDTNHFIVLNSKYL